METQLVCRNQLNTEYQQLASEHLSPLQELNWISQGLVSFLEQEPAFILLMLFCESVMYKDGKQ